MSVLLFQQDTTQEVLNAGQQVQGTISSWINYFWERLPYLVVGIVVLLIFFTIAYIVRKIISYAAQKANFDIMLASLLSRIGYYVVLILGFLIASVVIFPDLRTGDLVAGLGIGSVALGFAFKDVLQNLFAGFLILLYRPFHIGDQIKFEDFEGTVEDITVRATNIKTYDGERVVIPNNELYMNAIIVRTAFPHRRTKFIIGIGYSDDIEFARQSILDVLKKTEGVLDDPSPAVNVVDLAASSVNLAVKFWTDSTKSDVTRVSDNVITAVKKTLDEKGIDMPYPHRVLLTQDNQIQIAQES